MVGLCTEEVWVDLSDTVSQKILYDTVRLNSGLQIRQDVPPPWEKSTGNTEV